MTVLAAVGGLLLIFIVLRDGFETVILPRRVTRRVSLTGLFYRTTWMPWAAGARWLPTGNPREYYLSFYGPLSLLLLLMVWAVSLIVGCALVQWALGSAVHAPEGTATFGTLLYLSGTTFFTLGLGVIALGMPGAGAEGHPLDATGCQHAAVAQAVGVLEGARYHVGDALHIPMGMQGPDRARHQRVMVEDPQRANAHLLRVVVLVEAKVPAGLEPATIAGVDFLVAPDCQGRQTRRGIRRRGMEFRHEGSS